MKIMTTNARKGIQGLLISLLLVACSNDSPDAMIASAKAYLAKNDSKAAVIQIKNALQKNPNLPEARFLLGTALLEGGDVVGAETELRKALELKHPADLVIPQLVKAMLFRGQNKKIIDEFAKTELTQPSAKADFQTSLAAAYLALGKAQASQSALDAAVLAEPGYAPAMLAMARKKATEQDADGALVLVDGVIAKSSANYEAWKFKGDVLFFLKKRSEDAVAAYRKALESKSDFFPAHTAIVTLLLQQANIPEAKKQFELMKKIAPGGVQTVFLEAQLAYQQKDYKAARDLTQQLLKLVPDNSKSLQLAGIVELQLNSLVQAETYLSKALLVEPELALARRALIATYLRSGQPAKAMATLSPSLRNEILDPNLLSLAGEVYLQNGDSKKAEEFFAKAAKLDPKDSKKRISLAVTHLLTGDSDAAFGELQSISATDSGTTADLALISAHLARKDYDKALKAIDTLEKKQPDKPLAANLRGRTQLAKQDLAGARKSFERALVIDPTYFPAVASLAGLDMADKKPEEAKKRFEAVIAKDPKNGRALLALAELAARSGAAKDEVAALITTAITANPTDATPRLLLIDFYLRSKDDRNALSAAQNAIAALPENADLVDALGRTQQASGDLNQALTTFNKLAGMQPLSPKPQMRLADVQMAAKNKESAAQSLRKALEIKPDLLDAQRGLILLALDAKKYADALPIARAVQKQRPKEPVGYILEGDIAAVQKNWASSIVAYRNGLKLAPSSELALKLHAVLAVAGKTAESDQFTASWLKDHPADAAFHFYLGDVALKRNDYAAAEKNYATVTRLQPANAIAFNNLAWVSGRLNKPTAIGFAETANRLAPNQPAFMDTLAMLLSDKNDYVKALEWQTKVVAAQPQNTLFKLNLAKIHLKGGKNDLARKELDELAKLGDKFAGQAEVATLLKSL